ncbi:D-alanyl-D-alanine carboxypeptidase family protein [Synechococcus sp. RSCCF101]|uniref:M15 family metallopeptidase n=1 Tax=Synechococcus sp. RSCCF101 TaxID=2511069 RepID=UPI001243C104|nr:M15 family metallopeptidase [Synechococcus sp. RSCCF101]QEY31614.1 D-alanyl-D-alanine carboxypeptidase family protein [Synechococcus sp. RSCCF101]
MPRAAVQDEIPVARRIAPQQRRRRRGSRLILLTSLAVCAASALLVLRGRPRLAPQAPVAEDRIARLGPPDQEGRLFGHLPYPEASAADLVQVDASHRLHRDAAEAFLAMQDAAAADGVDLRLLSAFRSVSLQESIFFDVMEQRNQNARERALVSAPPGYSEHGTGFAVDVGDGLEPEADFSVSFENTAAFRWMEHHAPRHRFTLSFPPDNPQGVSYEPWHWRYEGSVAALHLFQAAQKLEP